MQATLFLWGSWPVAFTPGLANNKLQSSFDLNVARTIVNSASGVIVIVQVSRTWVQMLIDPSSLATHLKEAWCIAV
jgi:hypothetical protein